LHIRWHAMSRPSGAALLDDQHIRNRVEVVEDGPAQEDHGVADDHAYCGGAAEAVRLVAAEAVR
jgi:hypothetical protein